MIDLLDQFVKEDNKVVVEAAVLLPQVDSLLNSFIKEISIEHRLDYILYCPFLIDLKKEHEKIELNKSKLQRLFQYNLFIDAQFNLLRNIFDCQQTNDFLLYNGSPILFNAAQSLKIKSPTYYIFENLTLTTLQIIDLKKNLECKHCLFEKSCKNKV